MLAAEDAKPLQVLHGFTVLGYIAQPRVWSRACDSGLDQPRRCP